MKNNYRTLIGILFEQDTSAALNADISDLRQKFLGKAREATSKLTAEINRLRSLKGKQGFGEKDPEIAKKISELLAQRRTAAAPFKHKFNIMKHAVYMKHHGVAPEEIAGKHQKARAFFRSARGGGQQLDVEKYKKLGKKYALPAAGVAAALALTRPKKRASSYEEEE